MADVHTYTCIKRNKLHFPLLHFLEEMSVGLRAYNTGHKMATCFTERHILIAIKQKIGSERHGSLVVAVTTNFFVPHLHKYKLWIHETEYHGIMV